MDLFLSIYLEHILNALSYIKTVFSYYQLTIYIAIPHTFMLSNIFYVINILTQLKILKYLFTWYYKNMMIKVNLVSIYDYYDTFIL